MLFTLVVVFLLTTARAGYSLWQFHRFETVDGLIDLFLTGLRFDVALIASILLIPITIGTLLSMIGPLRAVARYFIMTFLVGGLALILLAEFITPLFLSEAELRPDLVMLKSLEDPLTSASALWTTMLIPSIIGLVLAVLIIIAFIGRLETSRFLQFRVSFFSGLVLIIGGGAVCILAMASSIDFAQPPMAMPLPLHPSNSLVSTDTVVNELSMNTLHKFGWSIGDAIKPASVASAE